MKTLSKLLLPALLTLGLSTSALAQGSKTSKKSTSPKESQTLTKDQRENMAKAHEQMASCLRTDKSMKECRDEMWKSCKDAGAGECPRMEHQGKHGHYKDTDEQSE